MNGERYEHIRTIFLDESGFFSQNFYLISGEVRLASSAALPHHSGSNNNHDEVKEREQGYIGPCHRRDSCRHLGIESEAEG